MLRAAAQGYRAQAGLERAVGPMTGMHSQSRGFKLEDLNWAWLLQCQSVRQQLTVTLTRILVKQEYSRLIVFSIRTMFDLPAHAAQKFPGHLLNQGSHASYHFDCR
jgi:hypothetical protein